MQSFISSIDKNNSMIPSFQSIPPSRLGFVCKPDMPPHINILFRARPPLEFVPHPAKGKSRPYEGVFGFRKDLKDLFSKEPPQKHMIDDMKKLNRLKSIVKNTEDHKAENKDKMKECKYLTIKVLVRD
jgi:hypothetical protein